MALLRRSRRGFTLVELMIVVGTIGVLSTIAIPGFKRAKQNARRAEMAAEQAEIVRMATLYFHQNGSFPTYDPLLPTCTYAGNGLGAWPTTNGCEKPGASRDFPWNRSPFKEIGRATNAPVEHTHQRYQVFSFSTLFYFCGVHDFDDNGQYGAACSVLISSGNGDLQIQEWDYPNGNALE